MSSQAKNEDIDGAGRGAKHQAKKEGGKVITLEVFTTSVLVGLIAGWLAGFMMKGGGYGLITDISLGLGGSLIGSWIFQALGITPGAGWFTMVVVAFVGAAIVMVAQRKVYAHA